MDELSSYYNFTGTGIATYYPDGSCSMTYPALMMDGAYITYYKNGYSKTFKNVFDDGYTTYQPDGSRSVTYKNLFDGGYTTYHVDGSRTVTYKNVLNNGFTTYESSRNGRDNITHFDAGFILGEIEAIANAFLQTDSDIDSVINRIENECSKFIQEINIVQCYFREQPTGGDLISTLYSALRHADHTKNELYFLKTEIRTYILNLRS